MLFAGGESLLFGVISLTIETFFMYLDESALKKDREENSTTCPRSL